MRTLGKSVEARYLELLEKSFEFPEGGYQGDYIIEIAKEIINNNGKDLKENDAQFLLSAEKTIFRQIKNSLNSLGIKFDIFSNEKFFYDSGAIKQLLSQLKDKGLIYEDDGATWYKATELGAKQDKVYIKSSGEPTYRLPETAYNRDKINRDFDLIVDVFGADHTDTYPDVLSALKALNLDTDHIKILIYQFVTLIKNGEKVKMSTRKADFITLDNLIDELGLDIVRYFFIMRSMNTHLDFDINVAKDQSEKNPVYYLQYAYARISSILRRADDIKVNLSESDQYKRLSHTTEIYLLKHMIILPAVIKSCLESFEPQSIANYLQELANRFHKFYGKCRVISNDKQLSSARLGLISATKIVFANGLSILGISFPEKM